VTEPAKMKPKAPGAHCDECPLRERPFAPGHGPAKAEYVLVGEAPGKDELRQQRPFVGQSGKLLNMILRHNGLERKDVYVTNAVLCRPPLKDGKNQPPNKKAMDCCHDRLVREIRKREPRRIIAAGGPASKSLLRNNVGITDSRIGGPKPWPDGDAEVVPTFHPAAALRNPDFFPSIIGDIKKAINVQVKWEPTKFKVVDDIHKAMRMAQKQVEHSKRLGFDAEWDHTSEADSRFTPNWLCMGISHRPGAAVVYTERVVKSKQFQQRLKRYLEDRDLTWIYQNGKGDVQRLWSFAPGARVGEDVMLRHYTTNEIKGSHDLEQLAAEFCFAPSYKSEARSHLPKKEASYRHLPLDVLHMYQATDVDVTHRLDGILDKVQRDDGVLRPYREILIPASYAFAIMEYHGVQIDVPYLKDEIGDQILNLANEREAKIMEIIEPYQDKIPGYNENFARSPKQIMAAFLVMYDLRLKSSDEEHLKPYLRKCPLAHAILDYREVQKLYGTYVKGPLRRLDSDLRLRADYKLHGTETGRSSCSDPNMQNWPMPEPDNPDAWNVRDAAIAPDGYSMLSCDYAGIELVVAAYLSGDETLINFIRKGESYHKMVAGEVFGEGYSKREYRDTKSVNFGALYWETAPHLAHRLGIKIRRAAQIQKTFYGRAPKLLPWQRGIAKAVVEDGELTSIFGRKRRFWLITDQNRNHLQKEGINFPIQSAAGDFTTTSLCRIVDHYDIRPDKPSDIWPVIDVHDSLTFEIENSLVDEAAHEIKAIMEDTMISDVVPTRVEAKIGKRWGSETDYEFK
jgi:uracil-DNA glycosylase family 4